MRKLSVILGVLAFCVLMQPAHDATANTTIKNAMRVQYPDMCQDLVDMALDCTLCHNSDESLNAYGLDLQAAELDFVAIENVDSDGDGRTNIEEIGKDCSNPGDPVSATEPASWSLIKALFD